MRQNKIWRLIIVGTWAMVATVGCGKSSSSSDSASAAVGISGKLGTANSSQSATTDGDVSAQTVDYTQLKIVCATLTAPIVSGIGSISSDGTFSLSISGGAGQPIACSMTDASGVKVADFMINDSSHKDINGKSQSSTSKVYKGDVNMGDISYDQGSGEVSVPAANISSVIDTTIVAATSIYDPTGAWTIHAVDFTLPNGVRSTCTTAEQNAGTCNGPPDGQTIYMKLWKGIMTADGSAVAGMQLWNSQSNYSTCGSVVGLTSAAKTSIGVDFSQNGGSDAPFTFATSVTGFHDNLSGTTGTVNLTSGWKMDTAKTQWSFQPSCGPVNLTLGSTSYSNAWVCGPDNSSIYMGNLAGGCVVTATGANVQVNNWTGFTCPAPTDSGDGQHVMTQSCTGTATVGGVANTPVTCSNKYVMLTKSGSVYTPTTTAFTWSDLTTINSGVLCSSLANGASSESLKIAQLQCYADYYYQSGMENASACLPKVNLDWSSTTSANFAQVDLQRPQGLVFFEQWNPHPDGNGGSMTTRQEHYDGVQVNSNTWVNCRVIETGSLSMRKISDSKLFVTYQSSTVTASTAKPACMAKFTGKRDTFVFYVTK